MRWITGNREYISFLVRFVFDCSLTCCTHDGNTIARRVDGTSDIRNSLVGVLTCVVLPHQLFHLSRFPLLYVLFSAGSLLMCVRHVRTSIDSPVSSTRPLTRNQVNAQ